MSCCNKWSHLCRQQILRFSTKENDGCSLTGKLVWDFQWSGDRDVIHAKIDKKDDAHNCEQFVIDVM